MNYTLRLSNPTFSGTEGLMSPASCQLVGQDLAQVPVDIVTGNGAITITSIRFELQRDVRRRRPGRSMPAPTCPPAVGDSKVFAMTGTITESGVINGSYSITVAPPTATCTLQVAGAKRV